MTEQHQDEAFSDSPVRLHDLDFNVSAPHMHATCLEALQLQPGHRLLDVGCGSGVINACAAYIVGHCYRCPQHTTHLWVCGALCMGVGGSICDALSLCVTCSVLIGGDISCHRCRRSVTSPFHVLT